MKDTNVLEKGFILHGEKAYKIESVLGRGGCGILYYATSVVMDGNIEQTHEYAIKEYFDKDYCRRLDDGKVELVNDNEEYKTVREEFRSEANCLKNLKPHKNIVRVNEVFEDNGTFYYVMEYLKGRTLRQYAKGGMSEKEAIDIVSSVAKALDYLHSEFINHLDVKPENIMLVDEGNSLRPVLIDFGLSKHFKKNGELGRSQGYDGVSEGYSPKEQYEGIRRFSPPTDVYALAATLYFLLTHTDPCSGKEMNSRFLWKSLPDSLSDNTANALNDALNPDVDKRTQDMATFYEELTGKPLHSTQGVGTKKLKTKKTGNQRKDNDNWQKMALAALGIGAIIILTIILWPKGEKKVTQTDGKETIEEIDTFPTDTLPVQIVEEDTLPKIHDEKPVKADNPSSSTGKQNSTKRTESVTHTTGILDLGYAKWTGGVKNGKPEGVGEMRFTRSHRLDSNTTAEEGDVFDGSYTNGQIDAGKLHRTNGEVITIIGEN